MKEYIYIYPRIRLGLRPLGRGEGRGSWPDMNGCIPNYFRHSTNGCMPNCVRHSTNGCIHEILKPNPESSKYGTSRQSYGLLSESQDQNVALTVLYVPHSLDSGRGWVLNLRTTTSQKCAAVPRRAGI